MLLNIRILLLLLLILSLLSIFSVAKKTITDLLYEDKRFSNLVRALQRTRILHEINRYESATLFAPVNEAFEDDPLMTRERMLYHFLIEEIKGEELKKNGLLLNTRLNMGEKLNTLGQKVKVEVESDSNIVYVGNGKITEFDKKADNGIIHVINGVLDTPVDLYTTLTSMDQLTVFSDYLRMRKLDDYLSNGNHITIFAPTNDVIKNQLKYHEREYLMGECGGGLDDLDLWTKYHLHNDRVLYSDSFENGNTNVPTVQGEPIKVEKDEQGNMRVAGGNVTFKDLLAENGVIHVITNVAIPKALHFTTHKYLCGLKATKFVASIIKHGLQHYIEGSNASYTILAPRDDSLDESLTLRYHILEGKYLPSDLKDEMLVKSELKTEELRNHRQRAIVNLVQKWDNNEVESIQRTEIQFNGIGVIGEPVEIGNDIIYILSNTMTPPQPIIKILSNDKQLASMGTYIIINNIVQKVRSAKGITMIAPSSEAFSQLGLINAYFLLHEAKVDLNSVLLHHIINETIYSEDITDEKTYYTMGGDPVKVYKKDNDIFVSNANYTSKVSRKDVLTSTGVLHVLDKVIFPPTLHITLGKLLKGINAQTFLEIVKAANLTDLVQDPLEPYTILAPTEGAFEKINVTKLLADPELASRWARLHIIPKKLDELKNGDEVPTLLSNDAILVIKKELGGSYYNIEVKGYWSFKEKAKLLSSGRAWNGGAVYEIDKVLLPEHVQQIGRTFSDIIIGFVLFGFLAMSGIYSWHFWNIWKRESQGYREIES
ncbi:unnamed protein product [Rhizophagus irregularis]|uniref:FAS1 domain-containing protein n=1 Tax=Rhizophagus irregularis TaxID=588596 RepID=A0A2I1GER8_9GLOM|nr:FAS1 domain-containing protein [Rhizophagus irregularis]CAB4410673.1 unnamed protein product [Rhizophagus irregularis]CAB4411477.1 unnamed protein product [Rhizophagus irregularis]